MTNDFGFEGSFDRWCRDVGGYFYLWYGVALHNIQINDMFSLWSV